MTSWWNKNVIGLIIPDPRIAARYVKPPVKDQTDVFKSWIGDYTQPTKLYCRQYVAEKGYKSIIDCGCGVATEYYDYQTDAYDIQYTGLDSCTYLVNLNRRNGLYMIEAELEKDLPLTDNTYECVYARDVMEHLSYYKKAINEFIRIGSKEILIGWFIRPDEQEDWINYWSEEDLYHNRYNLPKLETFILNNPKVERIFWNDVEEKGHILHIMLKIKQ